VTIETFDVVLYTAIFLLPGYIIKSTFDIFIPPPKHNDTKYFFTCLLYSIINFAVWSWAYILVINNIDGVMYWVVLLLITVAGASILSFAISIIRQKNYMKIILEKLNIKIINPTPTAWDYFFSCQKSFWVIVRLKSGTELYGLFSTQSFASSDFEERDIYIEKVYTIDDNMNWIEDNRSQGILIDKNEIETIEFFE